MVITCIIPSPIPWMILPEKIMAVFMEKVTTSQPNVVNVKETVRPLFLPILSASFPAIMQPNNPPKDTSPIKRSFKFAFIPKSSSISSP